MKKFTAALLALIFTASAASAAMLYPRNTQFADMTDKFYATVDFDYAYDRKAAGAVDNTNNTFQVPTVDMRYVLGERFRIGLNIPLVAADNDVGPVNQSAFGFGRLGLTTEWGLNDNFAWFINQEFPTGHNPLLGLNAYSFSTGAEFQYDVTDALRYFGEYGYRFDVPEGTQVLHSLIYNNAFVWDTGSWLNPTLELIGTTTFGTTAFSGTNLRIVPGSVTPFGSDEQYQFRLGFPIGLNNDSPDFGVQAGLYMAL